MIIVLDASGAIEIALKNQNSDKLLEIVKKADVVIAPDNFISEVTNAFWKYRKFRQFNDDICVKGIEFCINLIDDFLPSKDLWREAYYEGVKNKSSTYDMFYLIAARRNFGKLITMDKELFLIAKKEGLTIREGK